MEPSIGVSRNINTPTTTTDEADMLPDGITKLIAQSASGALLMEGLVRGADRQKLSGLIRKAVLEELAVEEKLAVEAEKILRANMQAVRAEGADPGELRDKILAQLAKEKGVVLR
jgi:hypothetical protein